MDGWLTLKGLRCQGRHGAYAEERRASRLFLLDVALRADLRAAAETDKLAATVDFAEIARVIEETVGSSSRRLLEAVALHVGRRLLRAFPLVSEVRVRVRKPDPPGVAADEESAELVVSRRTPQRAGPA